VRGQAFRALLDTKCATPSCPSPNRGYQTVIPDGVLSQDYESPSRPGDWRSALPTVRSNQRPFSSAFTPRPFA
jgi:hypothetical protein